MSRIQILVMISCTASDFTTSTGSHNTNVPFDGGLTRNVTSSGLADKVLSRGHGTRSL